MTTKLAGMFVVGPALMTMSAYYITRIWGWYLPWDRPTVAQVFGVGMAVALLRFRVRHEDLNPPLDPVQTWAVIAFAESGTLLVAWLMRWPLGVA